MAIDLAGENNDDQDRAPWPLHTARMIAMVSGRIEHGLSGKHLLAYYAARCSTPQPETCGAAYLAAAFIYGERPQAPLQRVSSERRREIYLDIPHRIMELRGADPVLPAAAQRVKACDSQNVWADAAAHRVCMAALALASVGTTLTKCSSCGGPGGEGLSLTTTHLDPMPGAEIHKYFDPQVVRALASGGRGASLLGFGPADTDLGNQEDTPTRRPGKTPLPTPPNGANHKGFYLEEGMRKTVEGGLCFHGAGTA